MVAKDNSFSKQISIGYLGPKILAPMEIKILSGIKEIAREHGITLFHLGGPYPGDSKEVISQSSFLFKLINPERLHGIIGWTSQLCNENGFFFDIEGFLDQNPNLPAVFIGKPVKDYPTVMIDNFHAVQEIMNHLIHVHNYRKIAFISGPESHPYAMERYQAYIQILKANNIAFDPKLVFHSKTFNPKYGTRAICHFLDDQNLKPKQDIEAIVSVSDVLSIRAIAELKKRNLKVPRDIAIASFNNKYESLSSNPSITTVDMDFMGIGKDSMGLLLSLLNGEQKSGIFYTPAKLLIRQSCGCKNKGSKLKKSSTGIPASEDHNSIKEFVDKLNRQKAKLISQVNEKTGIKPSLNSKWCQGLLKGLLDSLTMKSTQNFTHAIENTIELMAANNIEIFTWNQYFSEFRKKVLEITTDKEMNKRLKMLFFSGYELLLRQAEREAASKQMEMIYSQVQTIYLYQSIISTDELSTLLELLIQMLPKLGIEACYFSIFRNPGQSIEYASLKLAYNSTGVYKLYTNEVLFKSTQLIPDEYYHEMDELSYIILPLYFQDTPMGFIILGFSRLSESNRILYEVLRSLISNSLKRAMDMQELKFTQAQLEKKAEERRQAVLEAREANKQKTRFFINLAHETKTPLTLIQNYLAHYMEQHSPDENLQIVKQNIDFLTANILNFLDVEKLQMGITIFQHNTLINLSESVARKCVLFREVAKQKKIQIIQALEKDICIRVDPLALDRILNNLLDNAVKYIHEKGRIWVEVSSREEQAILQIRDNGPGLPVDTYDHIFEPYYLLSRKKIGWQGIGVGLSIVKRILDELAASIDVEKGNGGGTCFTIFFKKSKTTATQEPLQSIPATAPSPSVRGKLKERNLSPDKPSILVVDDNIQLLIFLQTSLEKKYNIYLARDSAEAIFKLSTIPPPDLIVSDIMMEGPDGFSLLENISKMKEHNNIPFVFLTALEGEEDKLRGLDLGAVDYIKKPFSIAALTAKINSLITLHQRRTIQGITHIHNKIEGMFSDIQKSSLHSQKPDFSMLCEKYKINGQEQKIIQLLLSDLLNKEIASQLNMSKRTLDYKLSKIYQKCGVNSKYNLLIKFQI